ncbi:hypothetical protein IMZ48_41820 [Candidatus Bathyarchaeota archaeon]|nr:hypothetical protein [Candidatus Bathyarchaeota archaeon]
MTLVEPTCRTRFVTGGSNGGVPLDGRRGGCPPFSGRLGGYGLDGLDGVEGSDDWAAVGVAGFNGFDGCRYFGMQDSGRHWAGQGASQPTGA